jgi:acetyltransferase
MPRELVIRPLAPHDAVRVQAFVRALSPQSRRERYFSAIQELTPAQLERTLRPRAPDVSLGAFDGERLAGIAECSAGEFAVVVADAWQARGLGRTLMERLLEHARGGKLPALHGIVRKGNRAMLCLGRSLGFRAMRDPDPELVQMTLELAPA